MITGATGATGGVLTGSAGGLTGTTPAFIPEGE
jgi:hypothetical protein